MRVFFSHLFHCFYLTDARGHFCYRCFQVDIVEFDKGIDNRLLAPPLSQALEKLFWADPAKSCVEQELVKCPTSICGMSEVKLTGKCKWSTLITHHIIHIFAYYMQTNNYRPMSVLAFIAKIFERIMYNRIIEFVIKH